MIITPFAYMKTGAAPAWSPADFNNVQYWWTADAGVTESGGNITSWTDQINSFSLTAINNPQFTTSATLNGQNVVQTNGTSNYLYSTGALASLAGSDVTILGVFNIIGAGTGGAFMGVIHLVGGNPGRSWVDTLSGNIRWYNSDMPGTGGVPTTIESPLTTGAHALKTRYDSSAGDGFYAYDTLTETTIATGQTTGQDWVANGTVAIGASISSTAGGVFLGRYVPVEMAEQVFIYGSPTPTEMTNWQTYVNNKYGTIIV